MAIIATTVPPEQMIDYDDGNGSSAHAQVVVLLPVAEANALAAARIARLPADLLAADAKPTAQAVADALIAAGYGS
tara:strand:+ start:1207 stop:1434 length:228 start_codon:yes stop_codon:yes gene_type:complete